MKILLSIFLVIFGVSGLVIGYQSRKKIKKEITKRVIANHLIAKDALSRLLSAGKISISDYSDAIEHLNDNSINIIVDSCGTSYIEEADWLMNEYQNELDKIMQELRRHMDEALPEFDCRKACPKKEAKR
jgi:phosphoglycerate-specific signal transduction histidine kinase